MKEILLNLDYQEVIITLWTVIILPILTYAGGQLNEWLKTKKLDKYANILKENVEAAIKDVQANFVNELKGTEEWTEETKAEALQMAKDKAIYALTNSAYEALKMANGDFDEYLTTLIEAKLYDLKK
jgi:hypothetical protein